MTLARTLTITTLMLAASLPAHAGGEVLPPVPRLPAHVVQAAEPPPPESLYVAIRGSINAFEKTSFQIDSASPLPTQDVTNDYRGGFGFSVAVGYDLGETIERMATRLEFEIGHTFASVGNHRVVNTPAPPALPVTTSFVGADARGTTHATYGMISYFLDWTYWRLRPFVGLGVGVAQVNFDRHGTSATGVVMDDRDLSVAWHLTAGLGFQISRALTLEASYRYFRVDDVNLTAADIGAPGSRVTSTTYLTNHMFQLGARMRF